MRVLSKKHISVILVLIYVFLSIPIGAVNVFAITYNPDAAIAYAAAHATDTPEIAGADCANFVSKCVSAGGISVSEKVCHNLMLALEPYASIITNLEIVISNGYGRVPTSGSNGSILSKGDVMFVCCERCKATGNNYERHAVIYSGEADSNGYAKCYAHTSMANNTTFWVGYNGTYACSNGHATSFLAAEVVHFGTTTPIVTSISPSSPYAIVGESITFNFPAINTNQYEMVISNITVDLCVMHAMLNVSNYTFNFTSPGLYLIEVNAYGQSIVGFESIYFEVHSGNRPDTYINSQKGEVYFTPQQTTILHCGEIQERLQEAVLFIYKSGIGLYYECSIMQNGLYTHTFEEGTYEANVLLTYKSGYGVYTQTIKWHIGNTPSNVILTSTAKDCTVGSKVTFKLTANDADLYSFGIGNGTDVLYEMTSANSEVSYTFEEHGTYYVWGSAINNYGTTIASPDHLTITVKKETYTVRYNSNGGSGAPAAQTKTHGENLILSNIKPTREGYTFLGWSTSYSTTTAMYQPGDTFTDDVSTLLYAVWKQGCENNSHSFSYRVTKTPTVSATGTLLGACSKCYETNTITLPKLNTESYNYSVQTDASCIATGIGRYTLKNTNYGDYYFEVTIPIQGHAEGTAATCTKDQTCTECGETIVPALGHKAGESATCTEPQTCTVCGEILKSALGHKAGEWTTLEDGSQEQRCTVCGELLDTKPAPEQPPVDPETKTYALGDINMDGTVNQYDYILAKRAHFNTITFNENQKVLGDMNEDGKNDQYDYILVKRIHFKNYSTDKTVEIVVE